MDTPLTGLTYFKLHLITWSLCALEKNHENETVVKTPVFNAALLQFSLEVNCIFMHFNAK